MSLNYHGFFASDIRKIAFLSSDLTNVRAWQICGQNIEFIYYIRPDFPYT